MKIHVEKRGEKVNVGINGAGSTLLGGFMLSCNEESKVNFTVNNCTILCPPDPKCSLLYKLHRFWELVVFAYKFIFRSDPADFPVGVKVVP